MLRTAEKHAKSGEIGLATDSFRKCAELASRTGDHLSQATALLRVAELTGSAADYEQAGKIFQGENRNLAGAKAFRSAASIFTAEGQYAKAERLLDRAVFLMEEDLDAPARQEDGNLLEPVSGTTELLAGLRVEQGSVLERRAGEMLESGKKRDAAGYLFRSALAYEGAMALTDPDSTPVSDIPNVDTSHVVRLYKESADLFRAENDKKSTALSLMGAARALSSDENKDAEILQISSEAAAIYEELKDQSDCIMSLETAALALDHLGRGKEAAQARRTIAEKYVQLISNSASGSTLIATNFGRALLIFLSIGDVTRASSILDQYSSRVSSDEPILRFAMALTEAARNKDAEAYDRARRESIQVPTLNPFIADAFSRAGKFVYDTLAPREDQKKTPEKLVKIPIAAATTRPREVTVTDNELRDIIADALDERLGQFRSGRQGWIILDVMRVVELLDHITDWALIEWDIQDIIDAISEARERLSRSFPSDRVVQKVCDDMKHVETALKKHPARTKIDAEEGRMLADNVERWHTAVRLAAESLAKTEAVIPTRIASTGATDLAEPLSVLLDRTDRILNRISDLENPISRILERTEKIAKDAAFWPDIAENIRTMPDEEAKKFDKCLEEAGKDKRLTKDDKKKIGILRKLFNEVRRMIKSEIDSKPKVAGLLVTAVAGLIGLAVANPVVGAITLATRIIVPRVLHRIYSKPDSSS